MKNIIERIHDYALEEIMGDRFGKYSKYIIQDRAIPDVRDGLKPVQRRILYSMFLNKNTYDKPTRKSAKAVGDVIGLFHPHGDTSVYDALTRLSQEWKMRYPLIQMQGNNGSIDGDPAAAYRYTEARLMKLAGELLKDIDKNTVVFSPNYDDTTTEPTVLPAKFPNLLCNGTTGISAGYATNIPPHNLEEVIDATIKRIDNPNSRIDTILDIVKGPDFPTGGIVMGLDGIRAALTTGKGRIFLRSKTEIIKDKAKKQIIITEIPYEVNKTLLVRKIDEIRVDKTLDGILEVRDESDKDGLRIAIDLKKEANEELILNYLYKNTDLQVSYNYNVIAIVNRRPKLLNILDIIDAYINHLKEVILERTKFDLAFLKKEYHICEGLIKAISILDEVIATIRGSSNKSSAIDNLVKEFDFTYEQAKAIVELQLYRLTNTDIVSLEEKLKNLKYVIDELERILSDENEFKNVMKTELRAIKKEYGNGRRSIISETFEEIKIDTEVLIPKEDVVTLITKDGYVKRTSKRGYLANTEEPLLKENDYVIGLFEQNTIDTLLIFTSLGNYLYLPVYDIPDIKWRALGKHISNIIKIDENEEVISAIPINDFDLNKNIVISSKDGMIKKTLINDFKVSRYSKPITCMKLKEKDRVVSVFIDYYNDVMISTRGCYNLWFGLEEVPVSGLKSSGVKSISLKSDEVVSVNNFGSLHEYLTVFTDKETAKRIKTSEFEKIGRARRGLLILREVKTNPYKIFKTFISDNRIYYGLKKDETIDNIKSTEITIADRYATGSVISKKKILDIFEVRDLEKKNNVNNSLENTEEDVQEEIVKPKENTDRKVVIKNHQISLLEIDDELAKIDEILK